MLTDFHLSTVHNLVGKIKPILANQSPDTQGAVLADLVAMFIAGHVGPQQDELRKTILELWLGTVHDLVDTYDAERKHS